jgi:hypothetical protein
MASKKSTWGKGTWGKGSWGKPAKKSTWGTPEQVARAVGKRGQAKSTGGKVRKLFGPLF